MLKRIEIEQFKSVTHLELELGRITALIGSNGSGKSNLLEAVAFAAGACAGKLDNEFLVSRGVRTTDPTFVGSAFEHTETPTVTVAVEDGGTKFDFHFFSTLHDGYPEWSALPRNPSATGLTDADLKQVEKEFAALLPTLTERLSTLAASDPVPAGRGRELAIQMLAALSKHQAEARNSVLADYLVFAPDTSTLRGGSKEGQVFPLGTRGDGLMRLVSTISRAEDQERWQDILETLRILEWFSGLEIRPPGLSGQEQLAIQDRFLAEDQRFDQRVANEGFMFLLFYATLFVAKQTPQFFAIDNIDSSLNPKACTRLMERLTELAKRYDKQVILTTHNPALLDGLDLHDDEHRLYATSRMRDGGTRLTRISAPEPVGGKSPLRLSEAFTRGLIGGLPQNF